MLFITAIITAIIYVPLTISQAPSIGRSLLKAVPVALLALYAFMENAPLVFVFALVFCALGDWLLSLENERGFLLGLISFALGHIAYTLFFVSDFVWPPLWVIVLIALFLALVMALTLPNAKEMRFAVLTYGVIIAIMAVAGFGAKGFSWLSVGIALFMFSDSLIAMEKFSAFDWARGVFARIAIWLTYFMGQALIVYGAIF